MAKHKEFTLDHRFNVRIQDPNKSALASPDVLDTDCLVAMNNAVREANLVDSDRVVIDAETVQGLHQLMGRVFTHMSNQRKEIDDLRTRVNNSEAREEGQFKPRKRGDKGWIV